MADPQPEVKGKFYCQAGDHIVDSVVWLETITLGCRPCMEKLGLHIATDKWTPRLWVVTSDGIKRATDIPRPDLVPKKTTPQEHQKLKEALAAHVSRSPFRGSPREYVKEHQDWTCMVCHRSDDTVSGYYNTERGYTCKRCTPTRPVSAALKGNYDQSYIEQRTRNPVEEFDRRRRELERKIERREREQERADEAIRRAMGIPASVPAAKPASITRQGGNSRIELKSVLPGQHVTAQGANSSIIVQGDVGEGATVIVQGGDSSIIVQGHIHKRAKVVAQGGSAFIKFGSRDPASQVTAQGGGATVQGRVLSEFPKSTEQARRELARTYGLEYDHPWVDAKLKMAKDVEHLGGLLYSISCVRCGKRVNVLGRDNAVEDFKCDDCLDKYPAQRRKLLSTIHGLRTVADRKSRPEKGHSGDWVYCIKEDQLFTWIENQRPGLGWAQVALPSAPKEKEHSHVWVQRFGDPRSFCTLCGVYQF